MQGFGTPLIAYASQLVGHALDTNIDTGLRGDGTVALDDGPALTAWLMGATANSPRQLIIDGVARVSGVYGPAGGYWSIRGLGWNTGFFMVAHTVDDVIHNGPAGSTNPSDPGGTAPARGKYVSLENFMVNGNWVGTGGSPFTGDFAPACISLKNLDYVTVRNVKCWDPQSYNTLFSNVGMIVVSGCHLESPVSSGSAGVRRLNTDGVHLDGLCNDVRISDTYFGCGDDCVAVNAPEGYGGNISRLVISNCIAVNSYNFVRLYTSSVSTAGYLIDVCEISNCTGDFTEHVFIPGDVPAGMAADSIGSCRVSNCVFRAPLISYTRANMGSWTFSEVTWLSPTAANAWIKFEAGCTISALSFLGCRIYRNAAGNAAAWLVDTNGQTGVTVGSLSIVDFAISGTAGQSYTAVAALLTIGASNTFSSLRIEGIDPANITALGTANIAAIGGSLLGTGWEFPDAAVTNGSNYLSATSHLPSIKIGGTVKTYTVS